MRKEYYAFCIDDNPIDQPTPKLVWGQYIRDIDLAVGDELFLINDHGQNFFIKEFREKDIVLSNPRNPSKDKVCVKHSPLFKNIGEIPKNQQEFFYDGVRVSGTIDMDGLFKPDEKYLVDALGVLDDFSNRPNPADLNGKDVVIGRMVRALHFAKTKGFKPTKS